ncbi:MAG: hypothetical protein ACI841_001626 [Planctomycetota bacterium]|jgi:hypothetical protein
MSRARHRCLRNSPASIRSKRASSFVEWDRLGSGQPRSDAGSRMRKLGQAPSHTQAGRLRDYKFNGTTAPLGRRNGSSAIGDLSMYAPARSAAAQKATSLDSSELDPECMPQPLVVFSRVVQLRRDTQKALRCRRPTTDRYLDLPVVPQAPLQRVLVQRNG